MTEASAADLAVVIANYETDAWLERCLRSLEAADGIERCAQDQHRGAARFRG